MLLNTRRRMLGLLAAAIGAPRLIPLVPVADAAETEDKPAAKKSECFALQAFGDWKGVATNAQAGARIGQISFADADSCDLRGDISVADSYDAKLVLYGDPDGTPLPKDFLVKPENRLIAKNEDGSIAVDEPLCGVCTGIRDDKVSIVLPLSTGALFRAAKSVEMTVKLGDAKACGFTLNCEDLRKALDWAKEKKKALAKSSRTKMRAAGQRLLLPRACFRRSASPTILGLRTSAAIAMRARRQARRQRRHRRVLSSGALDPRPAFSARPRRAPSFCLCAFHPAERRRGAAWTDALAYRLYARMMSELVRDFAPEVHRLGRTTE